MCGGVGGARGGEGVWVMCAEGGWVRCIKVRLQAHKVWIGPCRYRKLTTLAGLRYANLCSCL